MIKFLLIRIYDIFIIFFSIIKYRHLRLKYISQLFLYLIQNNDYIELNKKRLFLNKKSINSVIFIPKYFYEIHSLLATLHINKNSKVLDIGANIGVYGFVIKLLTEAKLWSFEPLFDSYKILEKNSSQFDNWYLRNKGIGESKHNINMYYIDGKETQASIYLENASYDLITNKRYQSSNVEIDRFPKDLHNELFDFVKIDVEGMEMSVINGLNNLRWRFLLIEYSSVRKNQCTKETLLQTIKEKLGNYEILKIESNLSEIEEILIKKTE